VVSGTAESEVRAVAGGEDGEAGINGRFGRNNMIRDAMLMCTQKPTWVSLIYRTEPTTKKVENRKIKN